ESYANNNVSEIAEEEKVLHSVLPPIKREPDHYTRGPNHFEPERNAHDLALYPQNASMKRCRAKIPLWRGLPRKCGYQRNLMGLTTVLRNSLIWVYKVSFFF